MNTKCPECGVEVDRLPENDSPFGGSEPICGCSYLSDSHEELVERLVVEKLRSIDERPGYNLYKAYEYLEARQGWCLLEENGYGSEKLEKYCLRINQMVAGMIVDDGDKVTRNFSMMEDTQNNIKQAIENLRRRDRDKLCGAGYAIPPWDGVLHDHTVPEEKDADEHEDIDEFIEDLSDGVPDFISESRIFEKEIQEKLREKYSPIVKKTQEDYTGVDVKFIGTAHNQGLMLEKIKNELKGCELVMVESSSTESLSPGTMIGHKAASSHMSYLNKDVVKVLEGYPDREFAERDPHESSLLSLFKSGGKTHDLKQRQEEIDSQRSKDPEYFRKILDERDQKFALQAIEHIVDAHYKEGISKAAIIAGKDHIPGMYQYFDSIGFGEDERENANQESEDTENVQDPDNSAFNW